MDDRNPSGYAQVLEEYQITGLSRVYNYGLDLISQRQVSSGTVSYYGYDGHGSTRFLLNTSGGITDTYAYDAFGTIITNTGTTLNNYLYAGQQFDSDLGLYYNRARYLNTGTGRFFTADSYNGNNEDPLSLHKYLYGADNPVNGIDPSGFSDNTDFGNRVQERITDDFVSQNRRYRDGNRAIGTMVGQPSIGPLAIRPDLFQKDNIDNFFYEIKSATPAEIAKGLEKVALYNSRLNYYGPWRPGTASDYIYAPNGSPIITLGRNNQPLPGGAVAVVLPPMGGLMTYIKLRGLPQGFEHFIAVDVLEFSNLAAAGDVAAEAAEIQQFSYTISTFAETATATASVGEATTITLTVDLSEAELIAF